MPIADYTTSTESAPSGDYRREASVPAYEMSESHRIWEAAARDISTPVPTRESPYGVNPCSEVGTMPPQPTGTLPSVTAQPSTEDYDRTVEAMRQMRVTLDQANVPAPERVYTFTNPIGRMVDAVKQLVTTDEKEALIAENKEFNQDFRTIRDEVTSFYLQGAKV